MDKKDKLLLYYLDKNSRESLTTLAKKLKTSKEVIHYRINRLQEQGYVTKFYTIVNLAKLGYVAYKVYFQFQNLSKETEREIVSYLSNHKRIFWVATCSGRWDLMIGTWAHNIVDFDKEIMQDIMNLFSSYILSKSITITKYNTQWSRRWFVDTKNLPMPSLSLVGGEPQEIKLDETDLEILKILANNARIKITELARRSNSTSSVAKYRMQQLVKKGIICSFRIVPNLKKMNYGFFKAFVYLQNSTFEKEKKLIRFCSQHKNILNIVSCVGSWDFEIEFEVENFEKFHEIMKTIREKFNDIIKNYESVIISSEPRVDFMPGCYPQF